MKTLLVVSDHDREVMRAALMDVGCDVDESARTSHDIGTKRNDYELAVVQLYDGDPVDVPDTLHESARALDIIRAITRHHPGCAILAITHSKITGDAELAIQAGAHWFQSVDWGVEVQPSAFLKGQIESAMENHRRKTAAA